jgi:cold shock CspA family protein
MRMWIIETKVTIQLETTMTTFELDIYVKTHSGFTTFRDLVDAFPHYTPTIDVSHPERLAIADAYDAHQAARGVPNRAYRRGAPTNLSAWDISSKDGCEDIYAHNERSRVEKIVQAPTRLVAGESVSYERNQGQRDAEVLAVLGDEALVSYEMPSGVTYLNIVAADGSDEPGAYRAVSVKALPKKWRKAIAAQYAPASGMPYVNVRLGGRVIGVQVTS